jgi:hypothetical protein
VGGDGVVVQIQRVDAVLMVVACLVAPALFPTLMRHVLTYYRVLKEAQRRVDAGQLPPADARTELKELPGLCADLYMVSMLPVTVAGVVFIGWAVAGALTDASPDFFGPVIATLPALGFLVLLMSPYLIASLCVYALIERRWVQFDDVDWLKKWPLIVRKVFDLLAWLGFSIEGKFRSDAFETRPSAGRLRRFVDRLFRSVAAHRVRLKVRRAA